MTSAIFWIQIGGLSTYYSSISAGFEFKEEEVVEKEREKNIIIRADAGIGVYRLVVF